MCEITERVMTGRCEWIRGHYCSINHIVPLLHFIDTKLRCQILHYLEDIVTWYFCLTVSFHLCPGLLLSPCTIIKILYFFYSNVYVCLPYKVLVLWGKGSISSPPGAREAWCSSPSGCRKGKDLSQGKYNYLVVQRDLMLLSNCQGSANPHQRQRGRGPTYVQPQRCAGRSAPSASLTVTLHLTPQDDCRRGALWPSWWHRTQEAKPL